VTSRADEIQKLIADIDNLLNNGNKRRPRLLSSQAPDTKEVLEKIRNFLIQETEGEILNGNESNPKSAEAQRSPLLEKFINQAQSESTAQLNLPQAETSNSLLQQLNQELSILIQPLQAELAAMIQERANLVQEIRQLEQRRLHHYSLSQQWTNQEQMISEFLQLLMNHVATNFKPQLAQNIGQNSSSTSTNIEASSRSSSFLETSQQAERLTNLTRELDQRLLSLDGTVNFVFEALQRNINTYHESLSQGLARMHNRGVQGEQLMVNFLNNLTQLLQEQAPMSVLSEEELTEKESLSSSPSFSLEDRTFPPEVIPADEIISATHHSEELLTPETTPPLMFSQPETEDAVVSDDLDVMLLELGVDDSLTSAQTASELTQDGLDLISDEVEELYASLLGSDNFTEPSLDVENLSPVGEAIPGFSTQILEPEVSSDETITETTDACANETLEPEVSSKETITEPTPVRLKPAIPKVSDPWLESTETESDSWQELFFEEDTNSEAPREVFDASSTDVTLGESLSLEPPSADTITSLAELFIDAGGEQEDFLASVGEEIASVIASEPPVSQDLDMLVDIPEAADVDHHIAPEATLIQQSDVLVDVPVQGDVDNYIPASPGENLLAPEENHSANLPDITLDEEEIELLNRDLANFDGSLQFEESLDIFADFEDRINQEILRAADSESFTESDVDLFQVTPISWPQTEGDLDFSPTTATKEQVTSAETGSASVSISDAGNDTDVVLDIEDAVWYLGLDVGTTGISAALLNRSHSVVYPICWSTDNQDRVSSFPESFRLPAEVYLPSVSLPPTETENTQLQELAEYQQHISYSVQLKPYLQIAVPYKNEQQQWEPVLQFNQFSAGPLIWVVRSLSKLLLTLKSDRQSTTQGLIASAVGLSAESFDHIINHLTGVICTCPSGWSEEYRFNVREAVLTSKLVAHPQQVFFVEEAIASLLSILDTPDGTPVQVSDAQGLHPAKPHDDALIGHTFVINIGATTTEMALVDISENLGQLTHNDFMLHSFAYASNGIEQDIICQLLLPPKYRQTREINQEDSQINNHNSWQWQPNFPDLNQMRWSSLGLEELDLPQLGEPDIPARIRLQQRLESSVLGQAVLDAALALKLILQQQDTFTLELADQKWVLQRKDLENQVFIPFVRRLNREFNKLLVVRGIPTEAINQAILTGGVASLAPVNNWLRQKLPNTKIIQDLYLGANGIPQCSRVAHGLAMLPLHPQILEAPKQQYTDYFLFMELLRLLPDKTLSFSEILQLFEGSGINTSICQQRLLAFLEGELPAGLIPAIPNSTWVSRNSQNNSDYQAIAAAPLFEKQGNLTYRPNFTQVAVLRRYLAAIKASTQQTMEEPYTVDFAVQVNQ
jgi:hypothetical protein